MPNRKQQADPLNELCERIKALRLSRGYTQQEVAEELGMSREGFVQYENGDIKNPNTDRMKKFSALMKAPLGWVLNREGKDPPLPKSNRKTRSKARTARPAEKVDEQTCDPSHRVPEVEMGIANHIDGWDEEPIAVWCIPPEIIRHFMMSRPGSVIIKRAAQSLDGFYQRGDYVFIDKTVTKYQNPGAYWVLDGGEPRRAVVTVKGTEPVAHLSFQGTDYGEKPVAGLKFLGKIVAVLRAA